MNHKIQHIFLIKQHKNKSILLYFAKLKHYFYVIKHIFQNKAVILYDFYQVQKAESISVYNLGIKEQCSRPAVHMVHQVMVSLAVIATHSRQVRVWEVVFAVLGRIVLHLFRIVVPIRQSTTFRRVAATTAMHQVLVHL